MKEFSGYKVEVDQSTKEEWSALMRSFDDATIIQSWDFAEVVCPKQQVSRLILRRGGEVAGLAQVRIVSLPFLKCGIAHVEWGPIWRRRGETPDQQIFASLLSALREEYAVRRKLFLRIAPNITGDVDMKLENILFEASFKRDLNARENRTIFKDISLPLPDIRMSLDKKWRNYLSRAERYNLEIRQGTSVQYYEEFLPVYHDLLRRKGLTPYINIDRWIRLQKVIPDTEKPHFFMAYYEGAAIAGILVSSLGDIGLPIVSANNSTGLKFFASYLLHWRVIEWLKENGCSYYDLGGIDPENNPGTYHFKKGLKGNEVSFIGRFVHCSNPLSMMLVRVGEPVRDSALKFLRRRRSD
jgi:hypothetical protein